MHLKPRHLLIVLLPAFLATGHLMLKANQSSFDGTIKIVNLLWSANPKSAADTLTATFEKALDRDQLSDLRSALTTLDAKVTELLQAKHDDDPRFLPSVAITLMADESNDSLSSVRPSAQEVSELLEKDADSRQHAMLLRLWFATQPDAAFSYFKRRVGDLTDSSEAASLIQAAVEQDREQTAKHLLADWPRLPDETKQLAVEPLTSTASTMGLLVQSIQDGGVNKDLLNTNQLRKWIRAGDEDLRGAIEKTWGKIREADNAERQRLVQETIALLESGKSGSVRRGQAVFTKVCSQCHVLHGIGFEVGPNIANNGRGSLSQLVSNVMDPSLVIGEAFQARTVLTYDGEVVSGLVVADSERYLKLKLQGGKIVEFEKEEDIELVKLNQKSLMPEGVEEQMSEQDLLDLFAFLCLLKPLDAADNELIPGTPPNLVQP